MRELLRSKPVQQCSGLHPAEQADLQPAGAWPQRLCPAVAGVLLTAKAPPGCTRAGRTENPTKSACDLIIAQGCEEIKLNLMSYFETTRFVTDSESVLACQGVSRSTMIPSIPDTAPCLLSFTAWSFGIPSFSISV